ncbi:GNAT family N-acetyltransferase [Streptomyces sp. NPDC013172]|uniref:GNAT family N-acetyltransferase n=1 Tax=Streptomyces sp. NPDC013172 TaxID=3155009 RepID=UPI0033FEFEB8
MITLREVSLSDLPEWSRAHQSAYFRHPTRIDASIHEAWFAPGELIGAYDGERCVGTLRCSPYELSVPGGTTIPAAGITNVAVVHTHRRQGILHTMMKTALQSAAQSGRAIAILIPTEYTLYGRYGFGPSIRSRRIEVDNTGGGTLRDQVESDHKGEIRNITAEETRHIGPQLYDRFRETQVGATQRKSAWWSNLTEEWFLTRRAVQPFYVTFRDSRGDTTGLVVYSATLLESERKIRFNLNVVENIFLNQESRDALWRFIFSLDNVSHVAISNIAIDDPITELLREPSLATTQFSHTAWLRILNLPEVLSARTYARDGRLRIKVNDQQGYCDGSWEISVTDRKALVSPVSGSVDIEIGIDSLASLYMGGGNAMTLCSAALIKEHSPGSTMLLNEMFRTPVAPWLPPNGLELV